MKQLILISEVGQEKTRSFRPRSCKGRRAAGAGHFPSPHLPPPGQALPPVGTSLRDSPRCLFITCAHLPPSSVTQNASCWQHRDTSGCGARDGAGAQRFCSAPECCHCSVLPEPPKCSVTSGLQELLTQILPRAASSTVPALSSELWSSGGAQPQGCVLCFRKFRGKIYVYIYVFPSGFLTSGFIAVVTSPLLCSLCCVLFGCSQTGAERWV